MHNEIVSCLWTRLKTTGYRSEQEEASTYKRAKTRAGTAFYAS